MSFFMMLAGASPVGSVPATSPELTSVSVMSTAAGVCSGNVPSPEAAIRVAWTADRFDAAVHTYKLYENGVLKVLQTGTLWAKVITGNVENGIGAPWTSAWTYRVDICNTAGTVLASMSSAEWVKTYGSCRATIGKPT